MKMNFVVYRSRVTNYFELSIVSYLFLTRRHVNVYSGSFISDMRAHYNVSILFQTKFMAGSKSSTFNSDFYLSCLWHFLKSISKEKRNKRTSEVCYSTLKKEQQYITIKLKRKKKETEFLQTTLSILMLHPTLKERLQLPSHSIADSIPSIHTYTYSSSSSRLESNQLPLPPTWNTHPRACDRRCRRWRGRAARASPGTSGSGSSRWRGSCWAPGWSASKRVARADRIPAWKAAPATAGSARSPPARCDFCARKRWERVCMSVYRGEGFARKMCSGGNSVAFGWFRARMQLGEYI